MRVLNKLLQYTITITLLVLQVMVSAPKLALAEVSSPVQALEILAKNKQIATKCKVLSAGETQELSDYAARAELAVARRSSVADAQAAITIGTAKGRAATCNEAAASEARETLTAARRALASLPVQEAAENDSGLFIENKSATPMRPSLIEPAIEPAPLNRAENEPKISIEWPQRNNTLARYRSAAMAYYVERRCQHLSRREAQQFWNSIVAQHNEALTRNKRRAVAAALQSAQAAATGMNCGMRTAEIVRRGFASVQTP
jgi:hypothetical protein